MTTLDPPASRPVKPQHPPVVASGYTPATVTDQVNKVVFGSTPKWWLVGFGISFAVVMMFLFAVTYLFAKGVGTAGKLYAVDTGYRR